LHEEWNVFTAFSQWRKRDLDYAEPVVEVFTECAGRHSLLETLGSCDEGTKNRP
jgi:hypothetical protein